MRAEELEALSSAVMFYVLHFSQYLRNTFHRTIETLPTYVLKWCMGQACKRVLQNGRSSA